MKLTLLPPHKWCSAEPNDSPSKWSTPQLLTDAYSAGFSGYNFYETDNLIELSPEGHPIAKGFTEPALLAAHDALYALKEKGTK